MSGESDSIAGPDAWNSPGVTWATVALRVPAPVAMRLEQAVGWKPGPLPVVFEVRAETELRADRTARVSYFPSELAPILYGDDGATRWSDRRHRTLVHRTPAPGGISLYLVGVEKHRVRVEGLLSDVLILHLAVAGASATDLASDGDRDLVCLSWLLRPARHLQAPPPAQLAAELGLTDDDLAQVLSLSDRWFTVLRTARHERDVLPLVRGAATGGPPSASNVHEKQLQKLQAGRLFEPSQTWQCEVGTRGVGFVRVLERRDDDSAFFDTAGPAYTRTIYFDLVHLVGFQHELLGDLRAQVVATEMPSVGGPADQYESVSALQRAAASYRIRVWWSNIGRGGWQEESFRLLQSDWDLRARLDDLEAEASGLAELVETVAEQEAQLQRQWNRRTSATVSLMLGGVAALAVPQTILAALALGVDLRDTPFLAWLPGVQATVQISVGVALAVFVGLGAAGAYAAYAAVRARRSTRNRRDPKSHHSHPIG